MKFSNLVLGVMFVLGTAFAQDRTGISVTGSGTVYGEPDIAVVELGVNVAHEDLETASNEATAAMNKLMETLTNSGIDKKDIRTSYFNIWIDQGYSASGELSTPTYRVHNVLLITIRDISNVGSILSDSLAAGANAVNNVQYSIADTTSLATQARELAVKDAQAKAEQLANLAGLSLGQLIMINDLSGGPIYPSTPLPGPMMSAEAVPVSAGTLAVTVMVELRYAIAE